MGKLPSPASAPASAPDPGSLTAGVSPADFALDGLYLTGIVKGRQRRVFAKKGGGNRYMIALSILTSQGMFRPERWSDILDPGDIPLVGSHVALKVGLTTYRTATGTGVRLTWGPDQVGDDF